MCYWAHFRMGRLNGPKFYCVRRRFRKQSVPLAGAYRKVPPFDRHTAWLSGTSVRAYPQVTNWLFTWPRFQAGFAHFSRNSAIF